MFGEYMVDEILKWVVRFILQITNQNKTPLYVLDPMYF